VAHNESFAERVIEVIESIPAGEVMTYGEVALEAGFPGAARAVGTLLAQSGNTLAWWRIVASNGRLVPDHEAEHTRRLAAEGVTFRPNGMVRFLKSPDR
jgi:methylated-DNA-protein-cysteine methyltransferase related protein